MEKKFRVADLTFSLKSIIKWINCPITGIIHIGAAEGQEKTFYNKAGLQDIIWIEPIPEQFEKLKENCKDNQCFNLAISDVNEEHVPFFVTTKPDASSLRPLKDLVKFSKARESTTIEVKTQTFDSFIEEYNIDLTHYNLIVIDVQGGEDKVLDGMHKSLSGIKAMLLEVNDIKTYKGCKTWKQLKPILLDSGFAVIKKQKINQGQSDVLLVRR